MNQRSERPKMSATVVAEGGPCSCQRRWVLKCASHMVTFNKLLWKEWQRRKRGTEGRREGGKEKWMPPNLPSLTFSLLLSWRSFSSAFPRGSYYKAVVLSCKHFIAQIDQGPAWVSCSWCSALSSRRYAAMKKNVIHEQYTKGYFQGKG